jgi:hypothetical protein
MDQPASYTKIIPQFILIEREEEAGQEGEGWGEKQQHQPQPSRL